MSEIARSLQKDILAKKTQERLERHLARCVASETKRKSSEVNASFVR
jgi:hypothetical protein